MRLTLVLLTFAAALRAQAPVGNIQNGKRLFDKDGCYQCHGFDGHGGAGARLAPNAITLPAFIAGFITAAYCV